MKNLRLRGEQWAVLETQSASLVLGKGFITLDDLPYIFICHISNIYSLSNIAVVLKNVSISRNNKVPTFRNLIF
jgi:hypothetical protein